MNERINELMVKAGIEIKSRRPYIDEEPDGYLESDNDFFLNNHDTIIRLLEEGGLEKFAKLIVRECLAYDKLAQSQTVVNGSEDYNAGREMGIEVFMNQIKKHFGVEE